MHIIGKILRLANTGFCAAGVAFLLQPAFGATLVDQTLPLLKTRTATYTNVTVTTRAENYIFIVYPGGMGSIKVTDLSQDARRQLGYIVDNAAQSQSLPSAGPAAVQARESKNGDAPLAPQVQAVKELQQKLQALHITPEFLYTVLAILFLIYLGFCYCCSQICAKAGNPGGLMVWLPILQILPLVRAAGMSGLWFFGFFIPGLNIIAQVLWSINIVRVRCKSVWVTVMLLLPVTSIFAFLYLAFSNEAVEEFTPTKKFQTRAAQAAA